MSELQQQAVRLIHGLSDENIRFLIEVIKRLMPQEVSEEEFQIAKESAEMQAFMRLDEARKEMKQYFPDDFNPEKELEEARFKRYGSFD